LNRKSLVMLVGMGVAIASFYVAYGASSYLLRLQNANQLLGCPYCSGYGCNADCPQKAIAIMLASGIFGVVVSLLLAVAWVARIRVPKCNEKTEKRGVP